MCELSPPDEVFWFTCGVLAPCVYTTDPGEGVYNNTFLLHPGLTVQTNITGLAESPSNVNAFRTSVCSECPDVSSRGTGKSDVVAVGAGVGVPLGVLLLAAVLSAFWYRRKWLRLRDERDTHREAVTNEARSKTPTSSGGEVDSSTRMAQLRSSSEPAELRGSRRPAELSNDRLQY